MEARPHIAMVAGEASGDLLAGLLLDGLKDRWPGLQASGIGGPQMAQRGFMAWWPSERLSVSGYVEVLLHLRELLAIRRQLAERLLAERPALFVGVDAPDFNLGLEQRLREGGVRTVHFVCPSIWAWRPERVQQIKASADHVLCIFPFEVDLLARHGIAATYVGHPLARVIPRVPDRTAARHALALPADARVVAILPGSRASEVRRLAPRFFAAAVLMLAERPGLQFVVPALPRLRALVEEAAREAGLGSELMVVEGRSHQVLEACDVTLIASGTATLEAALYKRPMVVSYAVNWLTYRLMKRKQLQPWVSLPNILCRDFVVPELLQSAATPQALAQATLQWFDAPDRVVTLRQRFERLHDELSRDTATLATDAIAQILGR